MTYTTPSTVMLVSAMLVATMTRRQLGGPGANTLACNLWSICPQQDAPQQKVGEGGG